MAVVTLDWLRRLGEDYGFAVGGFMGADQAWLIREDEPVFTFILDDGDGGRGFLETLGLYWGSADYMAKPLFHYLVLVGGALNPEHRDMLVSISTQYRVRVLMEPSTTELGSLVEEDVARLSRVMSRYSDGSLPSLVRSIRGWGETKPRFRQSLVCGAVYDPADLAVFSEGGSLGPSRRTVPCILEARGVALESVLPRLVEAGGALRFSTEHRNLPVVLEFTLGPESSLTLGYEAEKGNLFQAFEFEEWLASAAECGHVRLVDSQSLRVLVEFTLPGPAALSGGS